MINSKQELGNRVEHLRRTNTSEFILFWYNFLGPVVSSVKNTDLTRDNIIAEVEIQRGSMLLATEENTSLRNLISDFNPATYVWLESLPHQIKDLTSEEVEVLNEKLSNYNR